MTTPNIDYRSSGVDVLAGEQAVESIKELVRQSYNQKVLGGLGSFGGLYRFARPDLREPVLVASTDGVGTKLLVAVMADHYDTVGQDLVNHCVNDILVQGAEPLFFLDYIGMAVMDTERVRSLVQGMVQACVENSCALIGGEMAELPGIYHHRDFDLAGTIVGVVDQPNLLPSERVHKGDILVGIPSSGLHTNGYSLVRKIVFDKLRLSLDSFIPELDSTLGEILLAVHKSYLPMLRPLLKNAALHGLAHITGGGIPGNLKRIIPEGLTAFVSYSELEMPPLYHWLRDAGSLSLETLREAFNLGIGMIAALDPAICAEFVDQTGGTVVGEIGETRANDTAVVFIN